MILHVTVIKFPLRSLHRIFSKLLKTGLFFHYWIVTLENAYGIFKSKEREKYHDAIDNMTPQILKFALYRTYGCNIR
jgi:hypothetical protein